MRLEVQQRNEAEFANLTPEQQMDLVKTDDISDLAVRAKQNPRKSSWKQVLFQDMI